MSVNTHLHHNATKDNSVFLKRNKFFENYVLKYQNANTLGRRNFRILDANFSSKKSAKSSRVNQVYDFQDQGVEQLLSLELAPHGILDKKTLNDPRLFEVTLQLYNALEFLRDQGTVHNNIHPNQIIVKEAAFNQLKVQLTHPTSVRDTELQTFLKREVQSENSRQSFDDDFRSYAKLLHDLNVHPALKSHVDNALNDSEILPSDFFIEFYEKLQDHLIVNLGTKASQQEALAALAAGHNGEQLTGATFTYQDAYLNAPQTLNVTVQTFSFANELDNSRIFHQYEQSLAISTQVVRIYKYENSGTSKHELIVVRNAHNFTPLSAFLTEDNKHIVLYSLSDFVLSLNKHAQFDNQISADNIFVQRVDVTAGKTPFHYFAFRFGGTFHDKDQEAVYAAESTRQVKDFLSIANKSLGGGYGDLATFRTDILRLVPNSGDLIFNYSQPGNFRDDSELDYKQLKQSSFDFKQQHIVINQTETAIDYLGENLVRKFSDIIGLRELKLSFRENKLTNLSAANILNSFKELKQLTNLQIDLSQNRINFEDDLDYFSGLQASKNLTQLTFIAQNNGIQEKGLEKISKFISSLKKLVYLDLDLHENSTDDKTQLQFITELQALVDTLQILHVRVFSKSSSKAGKVAFWEQYFKLKKLTSTSFYFQEEDEETFKEVFAAFIKGMPNLSKVDHLNLDFSFCKLSAENLGKLFGVLKGLKDLRYLLLNFESNEWNTEHIKTLNSQWSAFATQLRGLTLGLGFNDLSQAVDLVGQGVQQLQKLEILQVNLEGNELSDDGVKSVASNLSKVANLGYLDINLKYNKIENATAFFDSFTPNATITNLSVKLGNNKITKAKFDKFIDTVNQSAKLIDLDIDFQCNKLESGTVQNLAANVKKIAKINHLQLNLSFQNISKEDYGALFQAIGSAKSIIEVTLELRFIENTDGVFKILGPHLGEFAHVKVFHLDVSFTKFTPADADQFRDNLKKLGNLQHFVLLANNNLENNEIVDRTITSLVQENFANVEGLRLEFEESKLHSEFLRNITKGLKHLKNLKDGIFNFNNNLFKLHDTLEFIGALAKFRELTVLELSFDTNLLNKGIEAIVNDLLKGQTHLNLKFSEVFDDQENFKFSEAFSSVTDLQVINLQFERLKINEKQVTDFVHLFGNNPLLRFVTVNLNQNAIGNVGFQNLVDSLTTLKHLRVLDLNVSQNHINLEGAKPEDPVPFCRSLGKFQQLKSFNLGLELNGIKQKACEVVGVELGKLNQLKNFDLNLRSNYVETEGFNFLSQHLGKLTQLKSFGIDLQNNNIDSLATFPDLLKGLTAVHTVKLIFGNHQITSVQIPPLVRAISNKVRNLTFHIESFDVTEEDLHAIFDNLATKSFIDSLDLNLEDQIISQPIADKITALTLGLRNLVKFQAKIRSTNEANQQYAQIVKQIDDLHLKYQRLNYYGILSEIQDIRPIRQFEGLTQSVNERFKDFLPQ